MIELDIWMKRLLKRKIKWVFKELRHLNSSFKIQKRMVIVVDYLSKDRLYQDLNNTNSQIRQILWLLSTFTSACQEMNIIPEIICLP